MDRRTQQQLQKIGRSIPKHLLKRGIIKEKPFGFERGLVEEVIADPRTPLDFKKSLRLALEDKRVYDTYERTTDREDPAIGKKIEKLVAAKVAREIRAGRMKPPPKHDPFLKFVKAHQ